MEITLIKQMDNSFKLAYNSDYDKAKKIKPGALIQCTIKQPRNYKFHKKFFALLQLVFDNQEIFSNIEHLRSELTKAAGYYTEYINHKGNKVYLPKSISFAKMDNTEFESFYNDVLNIVCKIFEFDKEEIAQNISQFY